MILKKKAPFLLVIFFRHCSRLGGIRLMWNKGVIIQKGPAAILLEELRAFDSK